jgi:hypothetical protein
MKTIKILALAFLVAAATLVKAEAPNAALSKLTKVYLTMKDALAADKSATAQAKAFNEAVKEVSNSKLDATQKTVWTKYAGKLQANGQQISGTTDIEIQRDYFLKLSDDFYAAIKGMKGSDVTLYRQYCPMKKGAWLSLSTEIANPYYGKDMLDCGSVRETLKAN